MVRIAWIIYLLSLIYGLSFGIMPFSKQSNHDLLSLCLLIVLDKVVGQVGTIFPTKPPDVEAERSSSSISNTLSLGFFNISYTDNSDSAGS
ncbi:hypothetical protein BKA70DRAFT_1350052 [Coprinopsis sp. MPI-PUGE-AT-0042]|nr:hypothetical protein BKA70DRAFT_1350052 [Coprinopsis sp. MPI-PUGE-AT-0042]